MGKINERGVHHFVYNNNNDDDNDNNNHNIISIFSTQMPVGY